MRQLKLIGTKFRVVTEAVVEKPEEEELMYQATGPTFESMRFANRRCSNRGSANAV